MIGAVNSKADTVHNQGSGICVVAQILEWKDQIWRFWQDVAEALEAQGQTLLLFSPYAPPGEARWPRVLPIPYSFGHYTAVPEESLSVDASWLDLLDTDDLYRTFLPPSRPAGKAQLAAARAFVRSLLDKLVPDVVMSWAPPFPTSQLLLGEARRREIPAFGLELGFLPNTLTVESQDVGFGSDLISLPSLSSALAAHRPVDGASDVLRDYYRERFPSASGSSRSATPRVIALLGSCPGFNLQPRASRLIRLASPWFGSFGEAVTALREALPADCRLVVRPHPADAEGQRFCQSHVPTPDVIRDGSVRSLIAEADVVAVLGSTRTQFEVVLEGKPILLLSRSSLWGQGIAYEFDGCNLRRSVERAFAREGWPSRTAAAERVLSFLAQHFLYGYAGAPVARGARDLAAFLGRFRVPPMGPGLRSQAVESLGVVDRFVEQTAPLLASYVCDELSRGVRPASPAYDSYVDAQLLAQIVQAGLVEVTICGAGPVGRRLARVLIERGIRVTAVLDRDLAQHGTLAEGAPVRGYDALPNMRTSAVLFADAQHEDEDRASVERMNLPGMRFFGRTTSLFIRETGVV